MSRQGELWHFIADKLRSNQHVTLMVVAESQGSSPGRAGYKMAVATDGDLCGSIGGGRMEVNLVERAKAGDSSPHIVDQVHRSNTPNPSGMICSGEQTVIFRKLSAADLPEIEKICRSFSERTSLLFTLTAKRLSVGPDNNRLAKISFEQTAEAFIYMESLGLHNRLYIVGGGHCALALSELMYKLDFSLYIFDDRPSLNTLEKNTFADEIVVIETYENIAAHILGGDAAYVVVMTLGYASDAVVIRELLDKDFKYFGVLGSKAKMATLLRDLKNEGYPSDRLDRLHTPIGIPIKSQTPEEIAVSIAAEIISVKNAR